MIYIIVLDIDVRTALKMQSVREKARRSKMLKIVNKQIHITRGDIACIEVSAKNDDGTDYTFQIGDVVRFKVFKKKDCNCVELQKDVTVDKVGTAIQIHLTSEDTKIDGIVNKPVEYWYEVELNPETAPQTIIGFDMEGEKIFKLYPEGSDK